jgi:NDP-sugar pyrophosphorylase family protein
LGKLAKTTPKSLMMVDGLPFLQYLLYQYAQYFDRIFLLGGHLGDQLLKYKSDNVIVVIEKEKLGTGGAILNVLDGLSEPFAVVNGDTFITCLDIEKLIRDSKHKTAVMTTIGGTHTGFDIFQKSVFSKYKGKYLDLHYTVLPDLAKKNVVYIQPVRGQMFDIGTPEGLEKFRKWVKGA